MNGKSHHINMGGRLLGNIFELFAGVGKHLREKLRGVTSECDSRQKMLEKIDK
jgi:hypothetical protein